MRSDERIERNLHVESQKLTRGTIPMNDRRLISYICNRAKTLDKWCQRFIDTYAESEPVQVVHLGCGLDTRNLRVDWMGRGPESVRWFDVDFPGAYSSTAYHERVS